MGRVAQTITQHDQTRARSEDGHPGSDARPQRIAHAKNARQLVNNGRFATRDDEPVHTVKFLWCANRDVGNPERIESPFVLAYIALQGENANQR